VPYAQLASHASQGVYNMRVHPKRETIVYRYRTFQLLPEADAVATYIHALNLSAFKSVFLVHYLHMISSTIYLLYTIPGAFQTLVHIRLCANNTGKKEKKKQKQKPP